MAQPRLVALVLVAALLHSCSCAAGAAAAGSNAAAGEALKAKVQDLLAGNAQFKTMTDFASNPEEMMAQMTAAFGTLLNQAAAGARSCTHPA